MPAINYIFWLLFSSVFFAAGEFLSKKFALNPGVTVVLFIVLVDAISVLLWLPAILQKNQLSIVGTEWSVLSLMVTVMIGLVFFHEKLTLVGVFGIVFAMISIALLSMA